MHSDLPGWIGACLVVLLLLVLFGGILLGFGIAELLRRF